MAVTDNILRKAQILKEINRTSQIQTPIAPDLFLPNHSGDLSPGKILRDQTLADTPYIPMVLFGTDDTPPTASTVPIGTIYVKYTP